MMKELMFQAMKNVKQPILQIMKHERTTYISSNENLRTQILSKEKLKTANTLIKRYENNTQF